jgi:hypothetical protein
MITAHKTPQTITPVFNPVAFEVSSNEQTRTDFRYKFELKDGGGAVINTMYYPGGATVGERKTIDVAGPLHYFANFDGWRREVQSGARLYYYAPFRIQYSVTITEEYSGALHNVYNSGAKYAIPASLGAIAFSLYDYSSYSAGGRWLTDFQSMKVRGKDKLTLSYLLPTTASAIASFAVKIYDRVGAEIASVSITNTESARSNDVVHVHAGVEELSPLFPGGIDTKIIKYYTIQPSNGGPIMRVNIIDGSCKYDGVRVHFLNEWGAVDSFTFELASIRSSRITKTRAKRSAASSFLRPSIYGVGSSPFLVTFTDSVRVNSGWLNDQESKSLLQMFTSPIVAVDAPLKLFLPNGNTDIITLPCEFDLDTYEVKERVNEKLFNLEAVLNIAIDNARQKL